MIELKDLVMLGQGAPNSLSGGRISRCVCAYSKEHGLVRLYPIPKKLLRQWDVFDATVELNTQDHRENTWKIYRSKEDWQRIEKWIRKKSEYPKEERSKLIQSLAKDNLGDLIKARKSFGVIEPKIIDFELVTQNSATSIQTKLFDPDYYIINQNEFKFKPYVVYECTAKCSCKNPQHKQQIVEWGCYEWMRKNPDSKEHCKKVFDNLRLTDKEWKTYFLVGNIHKSPKTYIIVGVLRFKKKN
ncbi:MAG: hypothetical protein NTZ73_00330 [Candidatus Diapherotrites archaeon]|nr:hypothetical protein [Candidatus Diapherotrites archaeon]